MSLVDAWALVPLAIIEATVAVVGVLVLIVVPLATVAISVSIRVKMCFMVKRWISKDQIGR